MNTKTKVILTIVSFTALGFLLGAQAPLGQLIWPAQDMTAHFGEPSPAVLGGLIFYGFLSSIAFGVGIAFLVFGAPLVRRLPVSAGLARAAHLAVTWLLVSWVPHDSLHQHISTMAALAGLEYGFHLTIIIGGLVLMRTLLAVAEASGTARPSTAGIAATGLVGKR